ncbi:hypothetical protein V8E36_008632 [Tilletia maclaganii]
MMSSCTAISQHFFERSKQIQKEPSKSRACATTQGRTFVWSLPKVQHLHYVRLCGTVEQSKVAPFPIIIRPLHDLPHRSRYARLQTIALNETNAASVPVSAASDLRLQRELNTTLARGRQLDDQLSQPIDDSNLARKEDTRRLLSTPVPVSIAQRSHRPRSARLPRGLEAEQQVRQHQQQPEQEERLPTRSGDKVIVLRPQMGGALAGQAPPTGHHSVGRSGRAQGGRGEDRLGAWSLRAQEGSAQLLNSVLRRNRRGPGPNQTEAADASLPPKHNSKNETDSAATADEFGGIDGVPSELSPLPPLLSSDPSSASSGDTDPTSSDWVLFYGNQVQDNGKVESGVFAVDVSSIVDLVTGKDQDQKPAAPFHQPDHNEHKAADVGDSSTGPFNFFSLNEAGSKDDRPPESFHSWLTGLEQEDSGTQAGAADAFQSPHSPSSSDSQGFSKGLIPSFDSKDDSKHSFSAGASSQPAPAPAGTDDHVPKPEPPPATATRHGATTAPAAMAAQKAQQDAPAPAPPTPAQPPVADTPDPAPADSPVQPPADAPADVLAQPPADASAAPPPPAESPAAGPAEASAEQQPDAPPPSQDDVPKDDAQAFDGQPPSPEETAAPSPTDAAPTPAPAQDTASSSDSALPSASASASGSASSSSSNAPSKSAGYTPRPFPSRSLSASGSAAAGSKPTNGTVPPSPAPGASTSETEGKSHAAAIVLGTFAGAAFVAVVGYFLYHQHKNSSQDDDDDNSSSDGASEAQRYASMHSGGSHGDGEDRLTDGAAVLARVWSARRRREMRDSTDLEKGDFVSPFADPVPQRGRGDGGDEDDDDELYPPPRLVGAMGMGSAVAVPPRARSVVSTIRAAPRGLDADRVGLAMLPDLDDSPRTRMRELNHLAKSASAAAAGAGGAIPAQRRVPVPPVGSLTSSRPNTTSSYEDPESRRSTLAPGSDVAAVHGDTGNMKRDGSKGSDQGSTSDQSTGQVSHVSYPFLSAMNRGRSVGSEDVLSPSSRSKDDSAIVGSGLTARNKSFGSSSRATRLLRNLRRASSPMLSPLSTPVIPPFAEHRHEPGSPRLDGQTGGSERTASLQARQETATNDALAALRSAAFPLPPARSTEGSSGSGGEKQVSTLPTLSPLDISSPRRPGNPQIQRTPSLAGIGAGTRYGGMARHFVSLLAGPVLARRDAQAEPMSSAGAAPAGAGVGSPGTAAGPASSLAATTSEMTMRPPASPMAFNSPLFPWDPNRTFAASPADTSMTPQVGGGGGGGPPSSSTTKPRTAAQDRLHFFKLRVTNSD